MDLHSGLPLWIATNKLYDYNKTLSENIEVEVAIIGSGITGSLVAHEICSRGITCCVVEKRSIGLGSTTASTSQIQYEVDVPLHELINTIGERDAVQAYKDCLQSIVDLKKVLDETKSAKTFAFVPTFYFASDKKGLSSLRKEYEARKKHNLPVEWMDEKTLSKTLGINKLGALYNDTSAQMDSYHAATGILDYHLNKGNLRLYAHTFVEQYKRLKDGYLLSTPSGNTIRCKYLIIAAGFEAGEFLPKKVMNLLSTYAIASQPLSEDQLWNTRALLWETKTPYLYMRTTTDNRIIVGGEDIPYSSPEKRDALLRRKADILERKFQRLFPAIPFVREMAWCGTFSSTRDGLPFIGAWPRRPRMLFALGYGGNGITFSMIAAQVLANIVQGKKDPRAKRYGFARLNHSAKG